MFNFITDKKLRKEQLQYITSLKNRISGGRKQFRGKKKKIPVDINKKLDDIYSRLTKVDKKLEAIEKKSKREVTSEKKEGVRKSRIKEKIKSVLKQHKKLTSSQLSQLIGLSRTRCNEYFKEMTREGITESVMIGRKKFYKLQNRK